MGCFYLFDLLEILPSNFYDSFVLLLLQLLLFPLRYVLSPAVVARIWVVFVICHLFMDLDLHHREGFFGLCDPHLTTINEK